MSVTLSYGGSAVMPGQFSEWTIWSAERRNSAFDTWFDVVWKNTTTGQYVVWTVGSNGNYLTQSAPLSGTSYARQSLETSFSHDLNGDGTVGVLTTTIESTGATTLSRIGDAYFLHAAGTTTGPQLMRGGEAVTDGKYGAWAPIGAEKTSYGYAVAWKNSETGQYIVWATDAAANYLSDVVAPDGGSSDAFKAVEVGLGQDLNGDALIASVSPTADTAGTTHLAQVLYQFFLNGAGGTPGPALRYGGAAVTAGQFGAWTPVGAEKTPNGYEVVWQNGAANQFIIWAVDNFGNWLSQGPAISGSSSAMQSREATFDQDFNGDGTTGPATVAIETQGGTDLTQVVDGYFLYASGTSSGPQLKYDGAAYVTGQFGDWAPIGAEKTASGYLVAWKMAGADQYLVWTTDLSGNWLSQTAIMSGASNALRAFEPFFAQNLNGDSGTESPSTIESQGNTSLVQVVDRFFLDPSSGSALGPALSRDGMPVTAGQYGAWTPVGAEKTSAGYLVAWKNSATGQFIFWTTDNAGNYRSDSGVLDTSSSALVAYEPIFNSDFNGLNGVAGLGSPIESSGTTSLFGVGANYLLRSADNAGVLLKQGGVPVQLAQFAGWNAIAAEQTATGYQVFWKNATTQLYVEWTTESNGNFVSQGAALSGGSAALQARETFFNQDLNGDTQTGLATITIESAGATSLVKIGDGYFLGGSSGSLLKHGGAAVTLGQFGTWAPIGVEKMANGSYQVVWKTIDQEQYIVWATDSSGSFLSQGSPMAGASYALQSLETSFSQNLNGDGTVGVVSTTIESTGTSTLAKVANNYLLFESGSTNGPMLKYDGAAVTEGQFAGWTPIAAEKTAAGYEVAWKAAGDSYVVWATDNNGNFQSQLVTAVDGGVMTAFEPVFQQDFGDAGTTIASVTTIESIGSASLLQVNGVYFLGQSGGAMGVPLLHNGGFAQFAGWTAYAATATATGYQVAWQHSDGILKVVWNVDSAGQLLSSTPGMFGSSSALESYETAFQQDLNGDGSVGVSAGSFNITLDFGSGGPDATALQYMSYFNAAVARWQQIIVGDLPSVNHFQHGLIDDIEIRVWIGPVDGQFGALGGGGPDLVRSSTSNIPYYGHLDIDSFDIDHIAADGRLVYTIEHEIAHALGFNAQVWDKMGLRDGDGNYIGEHGLYAYRMLTGNQSASYVPTTGGHLLESAFGRELMTSTMTTPGDPVSIVTIGILEDMGYKVNYSAADPYSIL